MTLEPRSGGFVVRLRFGRDAEGKPARERFLIATKDEAVAADIEIRMTAAAAALAKLRAPKAKEMLTEMGRVAADAKAFRALEGVVSKLVAEAGSAPPSGPASGPLTFAQVVDEWCSGRLHQLDPERVKFKKPRSLKVTRTTLNTFLPVLGSLAMSEINDKEVKAAKALIPAGLDPDSRRMYLSRLRSVFRLAVEPLDLIETIPKEIRSVPPPKRNRNLFWFIHPDEEARLLACTAIPLAWRVLYAWLHRNGGRVTETSRIDYLRLDLKRGRIRIEAEWTKTNKARFWNLEPDVLQAVRAWSVLDGNPIAESKVFHAPTRRSYSPRTLLDRLHSDLILAGIDRAELHLTTRGSRRLRGHDFRTGFCTQARRRGMPNDWIMDRSGHESAQNLERYQQLARSADDENLPVWWAPMDEAIPEIRAALAAGVGQGWARPVASSRKHAAPATGAYSITKSVTGENQAKTPSKPASVSPETPPRPASGPAENKGVGQTGQSGPGQAEVTPEPTEDTPERALVRIEEGLQRDLSVALDKGWLEIASKILGELSERRRARSAPGVPSLADRRKERKP